MYTLLQRCLIQHETATPSDEGEEEAAFEKPLNPPLVTDKQVSSKTALFKTQAVLKNSWVCLANACCEPDQQSLLYVIVVLCLLIAFVVFTGLCSFLVSFGARPADCLQGAGLSVEEDARPISVLRFWISEGLTQAEF